MTINIGLIGCGGIAGEHVKGYLKVAEDARVTAACDVSEENARRRSEQAGGARIFSDYHEMLAHSDVHAVDICLPHHLHKDAIVAPQSSVRVRSWMREYWGRSMSCAQRMLFIIIVYNQRQSAGAANAR